MAQQTKCWASEGGTTNLLRLNLGVFFKGLEQDVVVETAEWRSLFALKLPTRGELAISRPYVACREKREAVDPVLRMAQKVKKGIV